MNRPAPFAFVALLLGLVAAAPAGAVAPTATQSILGESTSPADLRARLMRYATAHASDDAVGAGEAWSAIGWSYWRGTAPDSAIAAWRRAFGSRGLPSDRYDLADALLERQAPGDVDSALALLGPALPELQAQSPRAAARFQALIAWGRLLAGESDESRRLFDAVESEISLEPLWRYRIARAALTGPDQAKAIVLLRTLAIESRAQDSEVMRLLEMAAQRMQQSDRLDRDLADRLQQRDIVEDRVVTRIDGRRIKFAANDGFPLSGIVLKASVARPRTAIVLMAHADTLADFDSLGVALRAAGLNTLLLPVRGAGWSVGADCPLPVGWRGREESMLRRTALDVRDAVRALKLAERNTDTTGVVLVASRDLALPGALAAARDRRIRALVLLSPNPDPVDRGEFVATLAKRPIPVFLQQTMEDFPNFELMDRAYQVTDRGASRVSEGRAAGHGAIAFKQDHRVTPRFTQWLKDALAPPKPATPPASRH